MWREPGELTGKVRRKRATTTCSVCSNRRRWSIRRGRRGGCRGTTGSWGRGGMGHHLRASSLSKRYGS